MPHRLLLTIASLFALAAPAVAEEPVDYLKEIKPLLREKCVSCHGALKQNAKLRLDTAALAKQGGRNGPAVRPGDARGSLLLERVGAKDDTDRMPPEGPPLTPAQIARLRAWIAQGVPAPADEAPERDPRDHWAFRRPQRPAVPRPKDEAWAANPIDAFLTAEHEKHGLVPRPPTDKALLLRRAHLDLIGLPPTRAELHAFLADTAPDAYEKVVDRLLADPRHGERWGRHWMDVWRYADWYGRRMVPDVWNSAPQVWRWRDWIVRSLNQDKGYDQMVREMLAADELAPEDDAAGVATGFLVRNWYALNPNDWMRSNVEHVGKAFLGLTFNCAHCHDHKYDPISHEDYFRFRAFFEPLGVRQDRVPGEADPGPFQEYQYSTLRKIQRLGMVRAFDKTPTAPTWFYTGGDERNRVKKKGSLAPGLPAILGDLPADVRPVPLPARAYYSGLRPAIRETILKEHAAALTQAEAELAAADVLGALRKQLALSAAEVIAAHSAWPLPAGRVREAARSLHAAEQKMQAAAAKVTAARAELASVQARIAADRAKYGEDPRADVSQRTKEAIAAERAANLAKAEAAVQTQESALAAAEIKPAADPSRAKEMATASQQLTAARAALDKAKKAAPTAAYTSFGAVYPTTSTGRRKALAEAITSPANPLTARVAVNHVWMRHFHAPLVASVFDFGRNGAAPTHPELLDWLAVEFMESGWSMKKLHRLIVTSRAYRMAANQGGTSANVTRDPENRFLWRMNIGRMEAEVVRDSLLHVAGQLDPTMGGQELENEQALTTRRRSLYYSCHPEGNGKSVFGALFDAPDAGECYRRMRTVIPQQALALTNSDLVHDLSAKLAKSLGDGTPDDGFVTAAYEAILSRRPSAAERAACTDFLKAADPLVREGLVRALLNHNDFVAIR